MIFEDTPKNYINQLILQVLSIKTKDQQNNKKISTIDFNKKRKIVDKLRVDENGIPLSNKDFKKQAMEYFKNNYKNYSEYYQTVSNALDDYVILENFFNY